MRESRISKLACGWVATILNRGKRQSESVVTIRFRQAQLHIQNKTCILHFAVEYSERLLTIHQSQQRQDLPVTLTTTFYDFPVNYPPESMTDVSIIKRIDLFAHNFTKIRWPAIFSRQFSRSMVKICILVRLEITLYIIDENVLSTNL